MKYSPTTRGFYDEEAPDDAVEVPDEAYRALFDAQATGKVIVPDGKGFPVAVDRPPIPLTTEMMLTAAGQKMDAAARAANYASLADVISYADDADVTFARDAARFRAWRSAVRAFVLGTHPSTYTGLGDFVAALPPLGS